MFRELLSGVILLARDGLGIFEGDGITSAVERFERVRRLSVDVQPDGPPAPAGLSAVSTFAGPHHLSGLLTRAAGTLPGQRPRACQRLLPAARTPRGGESGSERKPADGRLYGRITGALLEQDTWIAVSRWS